MPTTSIFFAFVLAILAFLASRYYRRVPHPPGPPGLPVLGVAREHPKTQFWKTYAEWGRLYGDGGLISFHVLGRRIVVINSTAVAEDLLARRSLIYSDRPFVPMGSELMKRHKNIFHMPYNERLKRYRKLLHQGFNMTASQAYWGVQQREAYTLVANLCKTPDKLLEHIRRNSAAVILKIAFGYTVDENNDRFINLSEEILKIASWAGAPGRWLVDSFPILRFLPDWFPGAGFKRQAKAWSDYTTKLSLEPHEYVKTQMASGVAEPSFTSRLLNEEETDTSDPDHDDIVLHTAGAIYSAGTDTTTAAIEVFFFAMAAYPEIQKRAQQEVDSIVTKERRLPNFHDRSAMHYLDCLMKEVLRWGCCVPLGLPHCTSEADVYGGYYVPAKTTVIPNMWAMMHDENDYPEPFRFNPDRFMNNGGSISPQRDPREIIFGFGRRTCPGQHVAESSIFIQMSTSLATLDVSKAIDKDGKEIKLEAVFTGGLVSHLKPFQCSITPRSEDALALIQHAVS